MKLGILDHLGVPTVVVFKNDTAFPLNSGVKPENFQSWLGRPEELGAIAEDVIRTGNGVKFDPAALRSPVPAPRKILGIGLNYYDHAAETGREPPKVQTWFVKQVTALNDPYGDVELPAVSDMLDYEVELVVVIGKGGRHIPAERADEAIAGYTVGCDYSVRDWQKATPTMIMGKGFDTHAPIGPYIVTSDEIGDLDTLRLTTHVNGEKRQDEVAGKLIYKVPELIAHLSAAFTLEPGDLIFTGTPAGVAMAMNPPAFLKDGDVVRVEIDRIGHLENRIVKEEGVTRIGA
jgi:2-keto-4-pentenoate hydratase/2-oxohepta-3-ene-1,7-dioic acid hydratase in catechol pathway